MTDRAKSILKKLEKNDLAKRPVSVDTEPEEEKSVPEQSEVEKIIAEADINSMTPMDALKLIFELKNKLNG